VITHFSLDPQAIRALEGNLDLAEDVLRHLVTRLEEVVEAK
jgi:ribosomal protein S6